MPFDPSSDPNNVTTAVFPSGAPADLATLKGDPADGDGHYTGAPFTAWQYVILLDGTQTFYDASSWTVGAAPPVGPYSGAVIASLETLRKMVGAVSSADDDNLDRALSSATGYVYDRVMVDHRDEPDVQYAILILATRLYSRRKTPEGVAGFSGEGLVVRIVANDPDIGRLLERHLDLATSRIA